MIHIIDAVLGDISPTKTELSLIDDPSMQRLHRIKQLDFTYLVYPGANHTRFEHSLGTMAITREIVGNATGASNEELECAGLLHDIGHAAFSHASDTALSKYLKTNHEKLGEKLLSSSPLRDIISDSGMSYRKLIGYFRGEGEGSIVTGALGSDRLDYLSRDSHYTGVGYGAVDYVNLKNKITIVKNRPAVYESALRNAEYLLLARYFMFSSVYHHHAIVIAKCMYERALFAALDSGSLDPGELISLDDNTMLSRLGSIKESRVLAERLMTRKLYKRAFYGTVNGVDEKELSEKILGAGFDEKGFVCRLGHFKGGDDNIMVVDRDRQIVGKITDVSPLVGALMKILNEHRYLVVACDRKDVKKMRGIVERFVGSAHKTKR